MSDVTVQFTGNLGKDPERRAAGSYGDVIESSVAVSKGRDATDWYKLTVWAARNPTLAAEFEKVPKGRRVDVVGRLTMDEWTDRDGNTRTTPVVAAYHVRAWPPRDGEENVRTAPRKAASQPKDAVPYSDDDDIPFHPEPL
jgi:single-strand DNA-binding protein